VSWPTPEGPYAFIQWKGTDVCMDFHCPCGHMGHVDDDFAYYVRCQGCGAVYEMNWYVTARQIPAEMADIEPKVAEA
jgi:hypothetical protein